MTVLRWDAIGQTVTTGGTGGAPNEGSFSEVDVR
jgi:hypothetical protein